jgi:phosphodiesterase/alkaline phosphatase D-like protein
VSSVRVTIKVRDVLRVRLMADTDPAFPAPLRSPLIDVDSFGLACGTIDGLDPATDYYIAAENERGDRDTTFTGTVRTPDTDIHSFTFGFASCADNSSNALVFDTIRAADLDFYIHLGDLHYRDVAVNDEALFQSAYDETFRRPRQRDLWSSLSTYYMWDDHDYGPNDSDRDAPGREAAISAYRRRVPSPPLAQPDGAPYSSFVRGRVRFILTDVRSERAPKGAFGTTSPNQVMFTPEQRDWFFAEILAAQSAGQVVVWCNTLPWIGATVTGADHWGGYRYAGEEIATFLTSTGNSDRVCIISGDMHALAYDDGTSANNTGSLHVCHAAAMDRIASSKGGPYLVGPIQVPSGQPLSQFGVMEVTDTGSSSIGFRFIGYSVDRSTGVPTEELDESFSLLA